MNIVKIENLKNNFTGLINGIWIQSGFYNMCYNYNPGNCKIFTLDSVSGFIKNRFEDFKWFVNNRPGGKFMFLINVIDKDIVDRVKSEFKVAYIQKVPIGYHDGFQYHCAFFVKDAPQNYINRVENQNKSNVKLNLNKAISKLTFEQLEKIKSYKTDYHRNNYMKKIGIYEED